jgi:peroxiredoxin
MCGLVITMLTAVSADAAYQVGDPVSDFTLYDASGAPVSLYDFEDTVILLNFWTDT